ncbi:MAG: transferase hexapeptide repeat containing protein [uncultured bacterium]|nr:MAG: transferase hexapeptide repeat containing protein [uncultured bacterium]OGT47581.1 MAG: hypothetical protein A3E83_06780 [Gammaproteobacteria bacterium RIFCSPHIGHO2_12_FULL_41_20]HLB43535.1 DapH/DapD/GlmU-related protein [Gammaproteobacteria bacterium]
MLNKHAYGENVQIGKNSTIAHNVIFIGHVLIGNNCKIGNNVILRSVAIGDNTIVEDNTILGYETITGHYYDQKPFLKKNVPFKDSEYKVIIGKNVLIRTGVTIYHDTTIGDNCWINHNALVREETIISADISIGSYTVVENKVLIGKKCAIHNHVMVCGETIIEPYVFIGPNVTFTNNSPIGHLRDLPATIRGPKLRLGCAIGGGATLCPGVEIGQEAIVGAGAIVTKDVSSRIIVAGSPAKKIKDVDPKSFIKKEIRDQCET